MQLFSAHHVNRTWPQLAGLMALVFALYAIAGIGMTYVAGFGAVNRHLEHAHWWWLAPAFGGVVIAFCGYYFGYRGVTRVEGGPELDLRALLAVVTAGFGGFLAQGATAIDEFALRASGADRREARVRTGALAGFEQATLALIVFPAAVAAVIAGVAIPRPSFTWPWAVIPVPAFVVIIALAERHRDRLRHLPGWRQPLGMFFDTSHLVFTLLRRPRRWPAVAGMGVYWGGDLFALWAATAAFGFRMSVLSVIIVLGSDTLFTRRTAPLAGSGLMMVVLVPTLWYVAGVPYATATLGVAAYRFLTLWVPLPGALAALPTLRQLGRTGEGTSGRGTRAETSEPALQV